MKNDSKMFQMLLLLILMFGVADAITTIFFIKNMELLPKETRLLYGLFPAGALARCWHIKQ